MHWSFPQTAINRLSTRSLPFLIHKHNVLPEHILVLHNRQCPDEMSKRPEKKGGVGVGGWGGRNGLVWLLLYAHRHRSILGADGHMILTPGNQLMVMRLKIWSLSHPGLNQRTFDHWPTLTNCSNRAHMEERWFGFVIALRPQPPKRIRGGWSHYTDTSEPVDGGVGTLRL
jgi:hypothetical protein